MYLQITTKCNMKCAHCCYSCNKNGKHMSYSDAVDAIAFAREWTEIISIGGGEPTLHPDFFKILDFCLRDFDYVWLATNGSQTNTMYRLHDIINGNDFHCTCKTDQQREYCTCEYGIYQENKLTVALSLDYFHDPINEKIVELWTRNASRHNKAHYETRDVTRSFKGVIKAGRASKTGNWQDETGCVCADIFIRPDGKVKLCGCAKSPIIGSIWYGIEDKWKEIMTNDEQFRDTNCFRSLSTK